MNKGLIELLDHLMESYIDEENYDYTAYIKLAKELKALEIIKTKEINIHALLLHLKRFDKPDGYNVLVGEKYKLTQEEYDLLKEVLKDDN